MGNSSKALYTPLTIYIIKVIKKMENIKVIEKARGMKKEGAIELLKYHQGLQEIKLNRLARQLAVADRVHEAIKQEIEKWEKEDESKRC